MSMKPEFFCCIGAELKDEIAGSLKSSRIFMYRAAESQTIADMLVDGFFNEADDLRVNDLILLYCPEQTRSHTFAKVSSVSGGVVKTTILKIDPQDIPIDTTGYSNISGSNLKQVLDSIDAQFDKYLRLDGTSTMTGVLKMRASVSFECALAPYWHGVGFYKLNDDDSVTLLASMEATDGFEPGTNNTYNIGTTTKKWKNLYLAGKAFIATINNGYDIAVPVTNSADTLALKSQVDLAANSGSQLYTTGVWYAKMHTETVAPSAADGTNYADFSQVDSDNNPIIVIYERKSGAWVELTRITPPANYNGYMTITSKIWDITEQAGQQGGLVLWSYNNKTFTPYPRIVSFDSISVTGTSTVIMPVSSSDNQITNKKYVDDAIAGAHYHPDLFDWKWADHQLNDVQWLRADTFSWQSGAVYEAAYDHLVDDIDGKALQSETIAGTTVQFYLADDGHKICPDTQESNVAAIYTATGVAWYYILDKTNQRFKLPRDNSQNKRVLIKDIKSGTTWARVYSDGWVEQGGPDTTTNKTINLLITMADTNYTVTCGFIISNQGAQYVTKATTSFTTYSEQHTSGTNGGWLVAGYANTTYLKNVVSQFEAQYKYLYFYVGNFTQTAIENTAGLNAELFNDKVDVGHEVIAFQRPTSANDYTWYRKYADGWVEMGGTGTTTSDTPYKVDLPVEMATQTSYQTFVQGKTATTGGTGWQVVPLQNTTYPKTSTSFYVQGSISGYNLTFYWRAEGMAAS